MIADEPSEQDIHGNMLEVKGVEGPRVTFNTKKQPDRTLGWTIGEPLPKVGDKLFVQSAGTQVRWARRPSKFEEKRTAQQADLRKRWESEGLPGTISIQHTFSGELEVLIDHEGMTAGRGRSARGDTVHIQAEPPIKAVVKSVAPWRERTQFRLVVGELAAADLKPGERVSVQDDAAAADDVPRGLPPGHRPAADERRTRRVVPREHLLHLQGSRRHLHGPLLHLASCNPNGCAAPNETRRQVREMIDKGLADREIWDGLLPRERATDAQAASLPVKYEAAGCRCCGGSAAHSIGRVSVLTPSIPVDYALQPLARGIIIGNQA